MHIFLCKSLSRLNYNCILRVFNTGTFFFKKLQFLFKIVNKLFTGIEV